MLAALRDPTGGQALCGEAAATDVWSHDVPATVAAQDLWPWLVILAMLLWPIDVGVRRLNVGRRDLVAARGWLGMRWAVRRSPAARTAASEQMLATRERATGSGTRATLVSSATERPAAPTPASTQPTKPTATAAPKAAAVAPPPTPPTPAPPSSAEPADTMARLKGARDRARR
jgi:pyruvate/2-oxoglutarate dehydrogenase complex dihydrolipoamide acyltransferase (E2) component